MSDFVHLHVHTDYSLLDGAAQIKPLLARAKALGMSALAITDHGNLFGALHFCNEAKKQGIKPLVGSEFYVAGGSRRERTGTEQGKQAYHLILLAKNRAGYRNLMTLSSLAYTEGFYYNPRVDNELLERYHEGLICLSACISGELPQLLLAGDRAGAEAFVARYKRWFGEDFFIELQDHGLDEQRRVKPRLIALARETATPMVLTNDAHYVLQEDWEAHDVLLCIGRQEKLNDPSHKGYGAKEFYLKSADEMARLFPEEPEMLANTKRIADRCEEDVIPQYDVADLKDCLPAYAIPAGFASGEAYLRHLVEAGLQSRYGQVTEELTARAEYELGVIARMGFTGYFLIVWDFINWAKGRDIPIGPGRGSGAGSIVAYATGITDIDPIRFNLLFERFLNPERISMPDFDIDICNEGRQAVIDYTRQKYGDEQVGHIVTFGTLKARAVIKDVGRVLDVPLGDVNMLTQRVPDLPKAHLKDAFAENDGVPGSGQLAEFRHDPRYEKMFDICFKLEDANRNTSLHASGIVIGKSRLPEWAPVFMFRDKKTDTEKIGTQYSMDIIESCGLVKMDYLGLKTLTLITHAERIIRKRPGLERFSAGAVDEADKNTFALFSSGKTAAVFQFESAGMQKVLRQVKPACIEDLVALNALYRPGPMDFIPQFIEGKADERKIKYPDPCLKDILAETYGVMVYQEQVMQVAQRIAGYSLGGADLLRRAMSKKKAEVMAAERQKFIGGAAKNGFGEKHAGDIFDIMLPFAGYGFNKSHAAAYSVLAYRTGYLKANFPAEFIAANLTNEIDNSDKLVNYIAESRAVGIGIVPPDINKSDCAFGVDGGKIVFGLLGIKGVGEAAAEKIVAERQARGAYKGFLDFLDRNDLRAVNKKALESLIMTGCFDSFGQSRATLYLNAGRAAEYSERKKADSASGQGSLFGDSGEQEFSAFAFEEAPDWDKLKKLSDEKELIGCYVSGHPLDDWRAAIESAATLTTKRFRDAQADKTYTLAGMVKNVRQMTTKKDHKPFGFAEIEDLEGTAEVAVWTKAWESFGSRLLSAAAEGVPVLAFSGKVRDGGDGGRRTFAAEELLDLNSLKPPAARELHIRLEGGFAEEALYPLRDLLLSQTGQCAVYFHAEAEGQPVTVKTPLAVPGTEAFIEALKEHPLVESVWKE
ncbi:DNA polymerase III subunit alpha [Treponema endosymbiont of Eucomonympha sp.]|uniref:DNA polymerase III subunit alpha n=1 Tax=Treponema endosymbiont of Eucomonympha sp. TaxID=1580831 RepID=UPI000781DD07|nr:DNA polymerase III subunit alpha [Treponema endosymbiont of Eucomonympha sp.]